MTDDPFAITYFFNCMNNTFTAGFVNATLIVASGSTIWLKSLWDGTWAANGGVPDDWEYNQFLQWTKTQVQEFPDGQGGTVEGLVFFVPLWASANDIIFQSPTIIKPCPIKRFP